jgi:hypothetical protein
MRLQSFVLTLVEKVINVVESTALSLCFLIGLEITSENREKGHYYLFLVLLWYYPQQRLKDIRINQTTIISFFQIILVQLLLLLSFDLKILLLLLLQRVYLLVQQLDLF